MDLEIHALAVEIPGINGSLVLVGAASWIEQISQLLHGLSYSDIQDDDYSLIVLEETTSPNFVETNSSNQHIYTAIYNAEIIRK